MAVEDQGTEAPTQNVAVARRRLTPADFVQRYALIGAWLLVVVLFGALRPDTFLTSDNFASIFSTQAVIVMLTLGLIIPLTTSDYDLSVAYNLTLSSMVLGVLQVNHHWPLALAILAALACGTMIGFVNGAIAILFKIDTLIVTLGTGTFVAGLTFWVSDSTTISGVSNTLVDWVVGHRILGIPIEFYYALVLALIIWYVFEFTAVGRRLLFVGRGRNVAKLSGLNVNRLRWGGLMAAGFLAALAGVVSAGTTGSADPTSGTTLLLPAFAAAFLGATAILPGRFNPWGSVVATYFLATGITGLQLLGVETFVQQLFYGAALIIAVVLSQVFRRGNESIAGPGG
jgi:ribose transport system permease protein